MRILKGNGLRMGLKYIVLAIIVLLFIGQAQAKGTVSFTFDDGNSSMDTIYNIFQPRGIVATINLISSEAWGINQNVTFLSKVSANGWEIGCHGATHSSFVTLSEDYIDTNYSNCKNYYNSLGYYINSFAYPYSAYNATSLKFLNKYFPLFRSPQTNITLDNMSLTNAGLYGEFTLVDIHTDKIDTAGVKNQINYSISNNSWVVFYSHTFNSTGWNTDGTGLFGQINMTDVADFVQQKIASNELNENTFSGSWYIRKNISSYFSVSKTYYDVVNGSYSLRQDTLKNIVLNVTGTNFTNLITNANFENWTDINTLDNWTKDAFVISVNKSSDSKYGTYSAYVNINTSKPFYNRDIIQFVNIPSNTSFNFSSFFKSVSNVTVAGVTLYYYNGSSDTGQSVSGTVSISNTSWDSMELTGTTTYNTTRILIQMYPNTVSGTNASLLIDGATLAASRLPDKFIEGNETGNVIVDINGTIFNTQGQSQQFSLSDAYNNYNLTNISSSGTGVSIINLSGDRVFATRYGIIEYANNKYNISEYSDSTVIEILSQGNYSLDRKTGINYSIRSGVTANIDDLSLTPSGGGTNIKISQWNTTGDYRKVFNLSASASVTAGDFAPNTNTWIYKNGVKWTIFKSNSTGYISFSDTIASTTQYSTTSTTVQDAYTTSTCQSTLNWGVVGSALVIILIIIGAGTLAIGFLTGVKFDTIPIEQFVLALIGVVVVGSIGVAIINPIIILIGCP